MQSDSNECFAQIDEEGDMKNVVGMEMAKVNAKIAKKLPQERMHRNPKSTNEISLEYNKFVGIGGWERFTYSGATSCGYLILKDAFEQNFFQGLPGDGRSDPLLVTTDLTGTLHHHPPYLLWARAAVFLPTHHHGSDLI